MNFHKETLIAMFEEVFISWENILFNIDTDSWLSEYYSYANYVLASKNGVILEKIKVFLQGEKIEKLNNQMTEVILRDFINQTGMKLDSEEKQEHRRRLNDELTFKMRSDKIKMILDTPNEAGEVLNVANLSV